MQVQITKHPKEEHFLKYNKENIMKQLLAAEHHLSKLGSKEDMEFAMCILKHTLFCEEEMEEAISHSLYISPEKSDKFKELRDMTVTFRLDLTKLEPKEAIERVRAIRRKFESFNPEFNMQNCKACGEAVKKIKETVEEIEEDEVESDTNVKMLLLVSSLILIGLITYANRQ